MTDAVSIAESRASPSARGRSPLRAVDGVSLSLKQGEVLALLGESGSGKSVTLRSILRLHPPRRTVMTGAIRVGGEDVLAKSESEMADLRGGRVAMIFQEPMLALDPVYTLGQQIVETIRRHENVSEADAHARALALFEQVRIPSPERRLDAYPHEMSGGMRQRAMIALALSCRPQRAAGRRAHDGAGRHGADPDPAAAARAADANSGCRSSSSRTTRRGRGGRRPHRRDVCGPHRGERQREGRDALAASSLYARPARLPRRTRAARATRLQTIPGAPPDLAALPPGCPFAPRCHAGHRGLHREPARSGERRARA